MEIVVLDGYAENPGDLSWEALAALGVLTVYERTLTETETISRIGGAEIVYTNKTPVTRQILAACRNIRFIGVLATGYDIVDVAAANDNGIVVTNVPDYGTNAVSQFAVALLLEICHHVGYHADIIHAGAWAHRRCWSFWDHPLIELAGKTIGIIGFGRIGRQTGIIAKALGMNVIAHDTHRDPALNGTICKYTGFAELLSASDVIALHCPLFPETKGIIRKENIEKMKDGVIIINNSRGALVIEQDLADALNSGKVFAAGLDVVSTEPIGDDNPLLKARNCIITPHISWAAKESRQRLMDIAVNNLRQYLAGTPVNIVN